MIPIGDWLPDQSIFNPAIASIMRNVRPIQGGWAPMPQWVPLSDPLPNGEHVHGAITVNDNQGNQMIFAASNVGIYQYNPDTFGWIDRTPTDTPCNVPEGAEMKFLLNGNYVLATNVNDGLMEFNLGGDTNFSRIPAAPKAAYVGSVGEYIVLTGLTGLPYRIQWSEIGTRYGWTVGKGGSDFQDFADGGYCQGIINGESGAFVFQKDVLRSMQYVGGQYTFAFAKADDTHGAVSPHAIVQDGSTFFYLDEDGFYAGPQGQPIGAEKINRTIIENMKLEDITIVQGAADPVDKMVWWLIPREDNTQTMVGYDWQLDRWAYAFVDLKFLLPATTVGVTLEGLDAYSTSIDNLGISLDSRLWKGGRPTFAGFNQENKLGFFSGEPMEATVETADVAIQPNMRSLVTDFHCVTDAVGHTGQIAAKENHAAIRQWSESIGTDEGTANMSCRSDGMLHRFRINLPAGEQWSFLHGVEPVVKPAGKR